jgi:hypothetical protein
MIFPVAHDPEKWAPVFGQDYALKTQLSGWYGVIAIRAMAGRPLYSSPGPSGLGTPAGGFIQKPGLSLNLPNLITLGRILLVPVVVWAIASNAMWIAFVLFLVAGVSDGVDGFLAERFNMATELGA